jgi:hypothetical protein
MTDIATPADGQPERRRVRRAALRLNATVREPGRSRIGVRLIDISTHGCRIESNGGMSADSSLLLSIAGLETQYCRIAWCCEQFAGLEFASPLAEPVLENLLRDHQSQTESTIGELREIADRTHRLASSHAGSGTESLAELSKECTVDALVEALRLGDSRREGGTAL